MSREARIAAVELLRLTVRGELLWNAPCVDKVAEVIDAIYGNGPKRDPGLVPPKEDLMSSGTGGKL